MGNLTLWSTCEYCEYEYEIKILEYTVWLK